MLFVFLKNKKITAKVQAKFEQATPSSSFLFVFFSIKGLSQEV